MNLPWNSIRRKRCKVRTQRKPESGYHRKNAGLGGRDFRGGGGGDPNTRGGWEGLIWCCPGISEESGGVEVNGRYEKGEMEKGCGIAYMRKTDIPWRRAREASFQKDRRC